MSKLLLMARVTYRRRVFSSSFLLLTLGMPAVMIVAAAVPILQARRSSAPRLGFVDLSHQLNPVRSVEVDGKSLAVETLDNPESARRAVESGDLDGFLVLPAIFREGNDAQYFGLESPSGTISRAMRSVVRQALILDASPAVLARLEDPSNVTLESAKDGTRLSSGAGLVIWVGLPVALGILFALAVVTGAAQMGSAVVREKDQRAMEIVLTSMSPGQLVSGKVLGMTALSLTQLGVWALGGGLALGVALVGRVDFSGVLIPWPALIWAALLGVPGYFLYATAASGLGIIAGDSQQGQQLAGMLGFFSMFPLALLGIVIEHPDGPLSVALTLFPLTAPMFGMIRMALTQVPIWELAGALASVLISLIFGLWAVSRVFRAAMLMYGQSLRPRAILDALVGR
jgi:ABC-2 type transport system permease protein